MKTANKRRSFQAVMMAVMMIVCVMLTTMRAHAEDETEVIDSEENVVVDFKYDLIQLIKGKLIFQARDFETNRIDIYDNKFDLALEMSNANIDILEKGIKVYNNEQEIFLDNTGKVITK